MKKVPALRILSYAIIIYLLFASLWWSVLLFRKNKEAYESKEQLLHLKFSIEGTAEKGFTAEQKDEISQLNDKFIRQEWMIAGEIAFFFAILSIGFLLINTAYSKQIRSALQQKNFLLSITHELKSPIASIKLALETIIKRDLTKEQTIKLLHAGLEENDRLNILIDNLLLTAKLDEKYQSVIEKADPVELIEAVIKVETLRHPAYQINFNIRDSIGAVRLDYNGMIIALHNLVENAIKYSPVNKSINIQLSRNDTGMMVIEVTDQGIGIPDDEKENVFDKFYRVGSEETRKTKGTGLGLYIVRKIVEAHSGHIEISNNQPAGTIFRLLFPID